MSLKVSAQVLNPAPLPGHVARSFQLLLLRREHAAQKQVSRALQSLKRLYQPHIALYCTVEVGSRPVQVNGPFLISINVFYL
jgi:hypothetical protein